MFQFPQFPLPTLCVQVRVTPHVGCRVSPFRHPRINAQSAAPRGLSQPLTSFVGRMCQGIHRWPLVACGLSLLHKVLQIELHSCAHSAGAPGGAPAPSCAQMLVLAMQFSRGDCPTAQRCWLKAHGTIGRNEWFPAATARSRDRAVPTGIQLASKRKRGAALRVARTPRRGSDWPEGLPAARRRRCSQRVSTS